MLESEVKTPEQSTAAQPPGHREYEVFLVTISEAAPDQWDPLTRRRFAECYADTLSDQGVDTVDDAVRAGYVHWGSTENPHMVNPTCATDGVAFRTDCPESLLVDNKANRVVGVMPIASNELAAQVNPAGDSGQWHVHTMPDGFCMGAELTMLEFPIDGACPDGVLTRRSPPMMHISIDTDVAPTFEHVHNAPKGDDVRSE